MKSLLITLLALAGLLFPTPGSLYAQEDLDPLIFFSLENQPDAKTLRTALQAADLIAALKEEGDLLLLAPTDEAFANLPEGVLEALLEPANKAKLRELLLFHLIADAEGAYTSVAADKLKDSGAKALSGIPCSNGFIYRIDRVLLPPGFKLKGLIE